MQVQHNSGRGRFVVSADGEGVEGRAGALLPVDVADRIGLTAGLSMALGRVRSWETHDPGVVARDLAVMLIDGGKTLAHLVGRSDETLFGRVASVPTAWRTVEAIAAGELALTRLEMVCAQVRQTVWAAGGGPAAARRKGSGPLCIDIDATLVTAHSEKDGAAGNYKGGFGFHPLLAYLDRGDGTGEALAGILRPGNAGANTAADHIEVFEQALYQLPVDPRKTQIVVRADSAGATHAFLDYLRQAKVGFSVGWPVDADVRDAIRALDEKAWRPARTQAGGIREGAHVAELTEHLELDGWPEGARVIVRREPLHPGAQQTLEDIDGHRFTALLTDQTGDVVVLERRHRAHARVEDRIRCGKDTGMRNLPCGDFDRNRVWLALVLLAQNLTAWTQTLCLDGELARAEPATLRYKLFHVAARITRHARQTFVAFQRDWAWADDLVAAFERLWALPLPAV